MIRNKAKVIVAMILVLAMCMTATGCMGGQKDIKKDEEAAYTEMVAAACEEYGYEYEQQTVLPKGSALCYVLSNGDDELDIRIRINEESAYDKIGCEFELTRNIASAEANTDGLEQHIPVLVKIAEHFTDEITVAAITDYLNDDSLWKEGTGEDDTLMYKENVGNLDHRVIKKGEELEEQFAFWWDNGKTYKLRKDK